MDIASSAAPGFARSEDVAALRHGIAFAFLMSAEFFYGWSWNTVDVLRPKIRDSLTLNLTQAGSAYTAQSLGTLTGAIFLGQVADRFVRRRTLFFVIAGYRICGGLRALVGSYLQLLGQRFLLGFSLGAMFPVPMALYMAGGSPTIVK